MKDIRTFSKKFSLPLFVFHLLDISTHCWPHTRNNAPMETPIAPLPATASIPFTLTPESWSEKEARLFPHDPDSEGISRTRPYSIDHANLEAVHLHLRTPSRRKCNIPRPRGSGIELVSIEPPASRRNAKEAWCVHSRTMERDSTRLRYPRIIFFLSFFLSLTLHFGEKDDSLFFVKLTSCQENLGTRRFRGGKTKVDVDRSNTLSWMNYFRSRRKNLVGMNLVQEDSWIIIKYQI